MNILLINHYAGSDRLGMEYRPFYLAREWVAAGHAVTIVAADTSHLRLSNPRVAADLEATEEEGVRFRWLRANHYVGNGARRVANMMIFVGKLRAYADRLARELRPDIVICSSTYPLDIYPGAAIARRAKARLVFEVHDLWPLTPILLGAYSRGHPYVRLLQHCEDWAYRHAETVVSVLPDTLGYMVERGLDPSKFVHIPNGVVGLAVRPPEDAGLPPAIEQRIETERAQGRFLVGYAGGIKLSMALDTLLGAARLLDRSGATFLLAGEGPEATAFAGRVAQAGLDNFHLIGAIEKPSIPTFLAQMDALAIPWRRSPLYRFGVSPNKIFDYMLAGKPILQSLDASNDLVSAADCGYTVPPEDDAAFAGAVSRLRDLSLGERRRLGDNGRRFVLQHHDYGTLARRYLQSIVAAGPSKAFVATAALPEARA